MSGPDDHDPRRAEARIDELEARLAQQDQSLLELGDEVYRQQRKIAALETQLERFRERFEAAAAREAAPSSGDERPPHY